MSKSQRLLVRVLIVLLALSAFVMPMVAVAGNAANERASMFVPPNATQEYRLQVGEFSLTIPAGAFPEGGRVSMAVQTKSDGSFTVKFTPERTFAEEVMMDFGAAADIVYYHENGNSLLPIPTDDFDGDGEGGEILSLHFSRYSGWH